MSGPFQRLNALQQHVSAPQSSTQEISDAYIISAARTPCATFNGAFTNTPAPVLGAVAVREAVARSTIPMTDIAQVYMGNVMQASQGQSPARQACIFAGLPSSVDAITINKVCASGMKAVTLAAQQIQLGQASAVVAGGMENMTRVPLYTPRASQQASFGDVKLEDGLIKDGLWDVYNDIHMGECAEGTAQNLRISRADQDSYATSSYERAQRAWSAGLFEEEVVPVTIELKKGKVVVSEDAGYKRLDIEKLSSLRPTFPRQGHGTITAASSSPLSDGASALVLCDKKTAKNHGRETKVLARVCGYADAAIDPIDFPMAPAKAIPIALDRAGIKADAVAVWEINEAFAAVVLANKQALEIGINKINPRGGAIALGHALGNSGSRIIVTLVHQLKMGEHGCAAVCNGGGAATAIVVQRVDVNDL